MSSKTVKSKRLRKLKDYLQATNFPDNTMSSNFSQQTSKNNNRKKRQPARNRKKNKGKEPAPPKPQRSFATQPQLNQGIPAAARPALPTMSRAVGDWARMVCDPASFDVVYSPATVPYMASKARIVKSVTVEGTEENRGQFAVVMRPSAINPLIYSHTLQSIPAVGTAQLSITSIGGVHYSKDAASPGEPDSNQFSIIEGGRQREAVMHMRDHVDANGLRYRALNIENSGGNVTVVVSNTILARDYHVKLAFTNEGGTWAYGALSRVVGWGNATLYDAASGADWFTVLLCDANGTPMSAENTHRLSISITCSAGRIPTPASVGSVYRFVKDEIIDAAHVQNVRITAASMLTTCMSSVNVTGGELVTANVRQSFLNLHNEVPTMMDAIKSLPESNRWKSTHAVQGSYTFYVPDDQASYEPHPYNDAHIDDNCLIVCGEVSFGTILRIEAVFITEFYTPSPLFDRTFTPAWDREFLQVLVRLQRGQMVSENEGHFDMVKKALRLAMRGYQFLEDHRDTIGTVAKIAASFL